MKYRIRLLRLVATLPLVLQFLNGSAVYADVPPPLIITEVKIRNDTAGLDEFIEIYNPSTDPVSLNDYFIGYINTPSPTADQQFTTAVIADGLLPAGQGLILAKHELDINMPNAKKSPFSSLSDSGGTLRITNAADTVIDQFTWTSTLSLAIDPIQYLCTSSTVACNVNKTQSFSRMKDPNDQFVLVSPTWQLDVPSPQSAALLPLPPPPTEPELDPAPAPVTDTLPEPDTQEETVADTTPPASETSTETQAQLVPPQITELLPNPAAPASDSSDEFIELYNPNDQPLNLDGYKLQSGNNFTYSHTFADITLAAHSYQAFMVTETGNILSNTSGQARLLDPIGIVVAQTNAYDSADDGSSWAFINGAWQWTTTATPDASNVLTLPILKIATIKTPVVKKVAAAKKVTKPKPKAKVAAAKKTSTKAVKGATAERQVYEDPTVSDTAPIHPSILAGVGTVAIVYAAYEYRHDALNALKRFRRYREVRRAARAASSGR